MFEAGNKGNPRKSMYMHICIYSKYSKQKITCVHGQLFRRTDVTHLLRESNKTENENFNNSHYYIDHWRQLTTILLREFTVSRASKTDRE